MVLDTGSGHGSGIGYGGVVAIDKDARVVDVSRKKIPRPERAIFMGPSLERVVIARARV